MPPPPRSVPLFTAYVTGDNFFPEDIHDQNRHIRDAGFFYMIAAEAINTDGGDPPLALYLLTDGNVGLGDSNDSAKNTLFGFATTGQNIAVGERVEVLTIQGAKIRGFSGLTIGTDYFVTDDATGSITTTNTGMPAGIAVDEDTLELKKILSAGATMAFVDTQVFSGTSPSAFTDLDLSGVVGSNVALVMLRVNTGSVNERAQFRTNGDTSDFAGYATGNSANQRYGYIWVKTDSAGIVEWHTSGDQAGAVIDVVAYITA